MTDQITYCANGCHTRPTPDAQPRPVTTHPPALLCDRCIDRLTSWLRTIPDHYALAPNLKEHGTVDRNPDVKAGRGVHPPAPLRLEVVDLLDTRHGRIWLGTAPAHDRRGVYGTLLVHVETIAETRPVPIPTSAATVTGACAFLTRHLTWATSQDWIPHLYADIQTTHRALADAVGDYRRPPVGHCHLTPDDTTTPCGGGLYANDYGGVRCARCGARWDASQLRILGLALAQEQP